MRLLAPAVAVLMLGACTSDAGDAEGPSLEGTTWVLEAGSIDALVDAAPKDARIDLTLADGEAHGTAACNTYGAAYTLDGHELRFGSFGTTQMACDPPLMDLEAAYLSALGDVGGSEVVADGTLVLTDGHVRLSYAREVPSEPLPLTGTEWRLTTIASETAVSSIVAGTEVTATFGQDGVVSGSDGCNRYHAPYETSDGSLTIGPLATTKMACEPDAQRQAHDVSVAMVATAAYEIDGTSLTLLDDAGDLLLQFDGSA